MDTSNNNNLVTPIKCQSGFYFSDNSDTSLSSICNQSPPSNNMMNNSITSNDSDTKCFSSVGICVTSTPFVRGSILQPRKSSTLKTKRYSIKPENSDKRADISCQVSAYLENRCINESILNEIHMNHFKFKFSRLNLIDFDFQCNESKIYLYPALYNCDILTSKFVFQEEQSHVSILEHRYDGESYVIKIGGASDYQHLSISSQKIIHEIKVLKLIGHHPHVEEYCDSWIEEARMCLQVECASGGSLYDHLKARTSNPVHKNVAISNQTAYILMAHISSVLIYMHDVLRLAHGAITTKHILLEFVGYRRHSDLKSDIFARCSNALINDDMNVNLRFKLCNFGQSLSFVYPSPPHIPNHSSQDIISLGVVLLQCFGGFFDVDSIYNNNFEDYFTGSNLMFDDLKFIIRNLCNNEPRERWTARDIISHKEIQRYILPEALFYFPDTTHTTELHPVNYIIPNNCEGATDFLTKSSDDYLIQTDNAVVNISSQIKTIESNRLKKEADLMNIHTNHLKFKLYRFNRNKGDTDSKEKFINDYPVPFNSDVVTFKFSSQILISDTKLSMIYLVDHRFDGHRYILKVGLQSQTLSLSESSHEIINEMRILKLIDHHPNIVGYCDSWIEQEKFHLQLKLIPGGSLYDFIHGQFDQFCALNDTEKRTQIYFLSSQSACVLLAHMASLLVYLHEQLDIFHGDIKPSNILVELVNSRSDPSNMNSAKSRCHQVLVSEEVNMNLRFKLCDFGRSGPTADVSSMEEGDGRYLPNLSEISESRTGATSRDIFSLGVTIYDCFCGMVEQDSARDIRVGKWRQWPERVSEEWRNVIKSMAHIDPDRRWSARDAAGIDMVQSFILPEARFHLSTAGSRFVHSAGCNSARSISEDHHRDDDDMDVSF